MSVISQFFENQEDLKKKRERKNQEDNQSREDNLLYFPLRALLLFSCISALHLKFFFVWYSDRNYVKSIDCFGYGHFNDVNPLPIRECGICFH